MAHDILQAAYRYCVTMAKTHYENFPVASRLLPKHIRLATAVIYTFARRADDIADEGSIAASQRHEQLAAMAIALDTLSNSTANDPLYIALSDVINRFNLPLEPFYHLLQAFVMDVDKKRYTNTDDVLNYCRLSANPIGALLLHLHGVANENNLLLSDRICTALQLINFYQDLRSDFMQRGRIYLPQDSLGLHGIDESYFVTARNDASIRALLQEKIADACRLLQQGAPLANQVNGRLRWELRAIVASGYRMIHKLLHRDNVFDRPVLSLIDTPAIMASILFYPPQLDCDRARLLRPL